jgi:hypothetical protein
MRTAKTNLGQKMFKQDDHLSYGSPNILSTKEILGKIIDIRFPGKTNKNNQIKGGSGIQVRIIFDKDALSSDVWYTLENDYSQVMSTVGNAEAVKALMPRVIYTYSPPMTTEGTAKLICDNTQERSFDYYESNQTNNIVGTFSSLASNTRPAGW